MLYLFCTVLIQIFDENVLVVQKLCSPLLRIISSSTEVIPLSWGGDDNMMTMFKQKRDWIYDNKKKGIYLYPWPIKKNNLRFPKCDIQAVKYSFYFLFRFTSVIENRARGERKPPPPLSLQFRVKKVEAAAKNPSWCSRSLDLNYFYICSFG